MNKSERIQPLRYPAEWPPPTKLELLLLWIPVLGWISAAILERRRVGPLVDKLYRQFESRDPQPVDYWPDEPRARIAESLIASCVEACCWPHSHFVPEDNFGVMLEARTGDGCEWDAQFRIEKSLELQLCGDDWKQLCELTLDKAVDFFASRMP